ncbi:MAG: hypothetical protein ACKVP0_27400 [Pirellulaceae bacterium]
MEGLDGRQHSIQVRDEPTAPKLIPSHAFAEPFEFTPADSEGLRFTLKELFIATTLAATMLAAFRALGITSAVLSFLVAIVATVLIIPLLIPDNIPRQRLFFDFVWGMVMPVVCLVFDPIVFKQGDVQGDRHVWMDGPGDAKVQIAELAYYAWPLLAGEIATLGAVLLFGKKLRPVAPVLAGALFVGFLVALCLGVLLSPLALLATLLIGIGLLGFTPIFTCWAYYRRMRVMWLLTKGERSLEWLYVWAALGILICLALAWLVGTVSLQLAIPAR